MEIARDRNHHRHRVAGVTGPCVRRETFDAGGWRGRGGEGRRALFGSQLIITNTIGAHNEDWGVCAEVGVRHATV